jgi:hypothetical protein
MRRHPRFAQCRQALALGLLLALAGGARGDGGTVRLAERVGGYRLTVFTEPTPLRAGPVDISVLVQDAATGRPLPTAEVLVVATPADGAGTEVSCPALPGAATNKLLHSAHFELSAAGRWRLEVRVAGPHGTANAAIPVEVAEPLPRWAEMWGWIALPIVPITMFVVFQLLTHRR